MGLVKIYLFGDPPLLLARKSDTILNLTCFRARWPVARFDSKFAASPIAQISNAAFGHRFQNTTTNDPNNGVNDLLCLFWVSVCHPQ